MLLFLLHHVTFITSKYVEHLLVGILRLSRKLSFNYCCVLFYGLSPYRFKSFAQGGHDDVCGQMQAFAKHLIKLFDSM
jgi:hypothetical protein